jgi:hypothetical protein
MPSLTVQDSLASLQGTASVVGQYFVTFNRGDFQQTTTLFSAQGALFPPFEAPITGHTAIAGYLETEAKGMVAEPTQVEIITLPTGQLQVDVRGRVQALVFKVPVGWRFVIAPQGTLDEVHVNLLASLEELLQIRPDAAFKHQA